MIKRWECCDFIFNQTLIIYPITLHIESVCVDWRKYQIHLPSLLRMAVLCIATLSLIIFRVITLHGHLPHFSSQDNPASFADSLTTRVLTYSYLYYYNAKLLVAPITLSYDWQMGSIPLVATLGDVRNFGTIVFFVYFVLLCWVILANFPKVSLKFTIWCKHFAHCIVLCPCVKKQKGRLNFYHCSCLHHMCHFLNDATHFLRNIVNKGL